MKSMSNGSAIVTQHGRLSIQKAFWSDKDKVLSAIIAIQINLLLVKNLFATTLRSIYQINNLLNPTCFAIVGLLFLVYITKYPLRFSQRSILVLFGCFLFWFFSILITPNLFQYRYVSDSLRTFVVYCVPMLLFVPLISKPVELWYALINGARISSVFILGCFLLIVFGAPMVNDYSMSFGKAAVVPCVTLLISYPQTKKKTDLLLIIVNIIAILAIGSRWPLLCIASGFIYCVAISTKLSGRKKIMYVFGVILCTLLLYIYSDTLLSILQQFLDSVNIRSRTINLWISGNLSNSTARDAIHDRLLAEINQSPFIGYGAGGGNVALNDELAHSFILDCLANFGYPIGILIMIAAAWKTIAVHMRKGYEPGLTEVVGIYACLFWPKVTIGESVWSSDKFWILISLFILYYKIRHQMKAVRGGYKSE